MTNDQIDPNDDPHIITPGTNGRDAARTHKRRNSCPYEIDSAAANEWFAEYDKEKGS